MTVICPKCGENNDNKFTFCVKCGTPLKGAPIPQKPVQAQPKPQKPVQQTQPKPQTPTQQPQPMQQPVAQPQMGMMPQGMPNMPQGMQQPMQPMPQGMAQPQMGMMPQGMPNMPQGMQQPMQPMPQGMAQPQMGMMPQNPAAMPPMENREQPQNPAMMPQGAMNPQMMGMPQMQGMMMGMMNMGMPQFMGYDPNGNPIYVQMVPQMVGYDAYGNPMYTMVPMQTYGMPQMGMMPQNPQQPVMAQPQMGMMPQNPQQSMMAQPVVQRTMQVSSFSEMPVSAEALMDEAEQSQGGADEQMIPDETELLNRIFSDSPKHNMSKGTKPGAQTFSISLSASEITSVRDEEVPPPKPVQAQPKPKPVKAKQAAAPPKRTQIISPDEFFGDSSTPAGKRMAKMKIDTTVIEDDAQLEEQIAALESEGHRKSKRSMQSADGALDPLAAVEDPTVAAAAQELLAQDGMLP